MNPYYDFKRQIIRQKRMYMATILSYETTLSHIDNLSPQNDEGFFYKDSSNPSYRIARSKKEIEQNYVKKYQYELRELILVRLISSLEVFLVDLVTYAFLNCKDLFKDQKKHTEINHSRLLSYNSISEIHTEFISRIRRDLHSGGFEKITKYYSATLNINLKAFNQIIDTETYNWYSLKEFHEKRHLIVHELGKTDQSYREKNANKLKITIEENELLIFTSLLESFGEYCNLKVEKLLLDNKNKAVKKNTLECRYVLMGDLELLESAFERNKTLYYKDKVLNIEDYHFKIANNGDSLTISVFGESKEIEVIRKHIRKIVKKQMENIETSDVFYKIHNCDFTDEELIKIEEGYNLCSGSERNLRKYLREIAKEKNVSLSFIHELCHKLGISELPAI